MDQGLIPRRYAKALFKVGIDRDDNKELYSLMLRLTDVFNAEPKLLAAVANPFVSNSDKVSLLENAVGFSVNGKSDSEVEKTFSDFLKLLIQNRRLDLIALIARSYVDLYRTMNNICKVEVVSAAPMTPVEEQRLKNIIEKHLDGASMEYSKRIDPDLIGGFIVNINSERLDASVKNELKQLRLNLLN